MRYRLCVQACAVSFLVSSLGGCFSSSTKEEFYYRLQGPRSPMEKSQGPRLLVAEFSTAPGYDTARIAYRLSDHEIRYYGYRQWVAEPGRMVADMTVKHLRASGFFSEVSMSERVRNPTGMLTASIDTIEELDAGTELWQAHLAMTFTLRRPDTEQIILRHSFDTLVPCTKRDPREVAQGISQILDKEIKTLARRVFNALK